MSSERVSDKESERTETDVNTGTRDGEITDEPEEERRGEEDEEEGFSVLSDLPVEMSERRPTCRRCCRPVKVCLCPFLPAHPLGVSTSVYILQHPAEESRVLRTVPLLAACLPAGKCRVLVGRRFSEEREPELAAVCGRSNTLLLFPGATAENLEDLSEDLSGAERSLVLIDGTWSQARDIFLRNLLLRRPRQVQLGRVPSSQYVIRTQPTDTCVSTLECAATALAVLEKDQSIREVLLKPLQALCGFQLQHGAQIHHSTEHQLKHGQYHKVMPRNKRKIRRMQKLMGSMNISGTNEDLRINS